MAEEGQKLDDIGSDWANALNEQAGAQATDSSGQPSLGDMNLNFGGDAAQPGIAEGFTNAPARDGAAAEGDIGMVMDIPVNLSVELGRTKVPIKNILQLAQGSIVELDTLAGEPMDVLVNGYLIAQGEVVVVNEKFGIRLTDIVTPSERLRRASKR